MAASETDSPFLTKAELMAQWNKIPAQDPRDRCRFLPPARWTKIPRLEDCETPAQIRSVSRSLELGTPYVITKIAHYVFVRGTIRKYTAQLKKFRTRRDQYFERLRELQSERTALAGTNDWLLALNAIEIHNCEDEIRWTGIRIRESLRRLWLFCFPHTLKAIVSASRNQDGGDGQRNGNGEKQ